MKYKVEQISADEASQLCRIITADLPDYFGLPDCNEHYAVGVKSRVNFAIKIKNTYVALLSLDFPYPTNSNIYWMGVLQRHHGYGIGKQLIIEAARYAHQHGAITMTVETLAPGESDENYLKTYLFYERQGFKPLFNLKPAGYEWKMVYMTKELRVGKYMNKLKARLITATLADYPTVQNMARFYVYDRTKYMGWECPETGLYECIDFKHYFETPGEHAYLIRVNNELAGFVLLDKMQLTETCDWNMGEFFIVAKFQSHGVGGQIAKELFSLYPGRWSVAVMPENLGAVNFWRNIIRTITQDQFNEVSKAKKELTTPDNLDPYSMIIFYFNTADLA